MTGFMQDSPRLPAATTEAAAATAATTKWTCPAGRRSRGGGLRELDADDDDVAFVQAVGDFCAGTVTDAGLDGDSLRRRVAGILVGGKNVNGVRRGL